MLISVRELELRKARFDLALSPGVVDFVDSGLRQLTSLQAAGTVELVRNGMGEIRISGHLKVMLEADCDRCLEATRLPVDTSMELFYRPDTEDFRSGDEIAIRNRFLLRRASRVK